MKLLIHTQTWTYFAVYVITYPCQHNLFHSKWATANQGLIQTVISIIIIQHY